MITEDTLRAPSDASTSRDGLHAETHRPTASRQDTTILLVGVIAFISLLVYIAYAIGTARTVGSTSPVASEPAQQKGQEGVRSGTRPWQPVGAHLSPARHGSPHGPGLRVAAALPPTKPWFGAQIPTIVVQPSAGRAEVSFWVKASGRARVGVQVSAFTTGGQSRHVIDRSVGVRSKWRHVTFTGRVRPGMAGLGCFLYQSGNVGLGSWFVIRGFTFRNGVAGR